MICPPPSDGRGSLMPHAYAKLILHFDGGARGNPGPAALGVTLQQPDGRTVYEAGEFLGVKTNNVAEYEALTRGLEIACQLQVRELVIRADSELVVRQIQGRYRVRHANLRPLYQRVQGLLARIPRWSIEHVYREANHRADELANLALDRRGKVEPSGPACPDGTGGA